MAGEVWSVESQGPTEQVPSPWLPWRPQSCPLLCSILPFPWWVLGKRVGEAMDHTLPPDTQESFVVTKQNSFKKTN